MKLIDLEHSTRKNKRYAAVFQLNGKEIRVHFGDDRYQAFVDHSDVIRRKRYLQRHQHDRINDPMTPGSLSYHILWGESPDIDYNYDAFVNKFNL